MKKREPINAVSLGTAIAGLVIGIILLLNEDLLTTISYIISIILGGYGLFKLIISAIRKKKGAEIELGDFLTGFAALLFAIIIAIFANKFVIVVLSIVLGTLALLFGINRLIFGLTIRKIDNRGSLLFIGESLLVVLFGVLIIIFRLPKVLGAFLVIYAILELVSYVYYKISDKDYEQVLNKKISKEIKESKSVEAVIEEDTAKLNDGKVIEAIVEEND